MTTVIVMDEQWRDVVEQAMEQGHARGLPKPAGLGDDGNFNLATSKRSNGTVQRTLYYGAQGGWTVLGRCVEDQGQPAEAASVNGTGKGKAARSVDRPKQAPPPTGPAPVREPVVSVLSAARPMMLVEPGPDGTRFHAYGLELPEVIEELRRCLVHLVATSAGMEVISAVVPRNAAVVAEGLPRRPPTPLALRGATQPARNDGPTGKRKAGGQVKRTVSYPRDRSEFDEDEDEDGPQDAW